MRSNSGRGESRPKRSTNTRHHRKYAKDNNGATHGRPVQQRRLHRVLHSAVTPAWAHADWPRPHCTRPGRVPGDGPWPVTRPSARRLYTKRRKDCLLQRVPCVQREATLNARWSLALPTALGPTRPLARSMALGPERPPATARSQRAKRRSGCRRGLCRTTFARKPLVPAQLPPGWSAHDTRNLRSINIKRASGINT